MNQNVPVLIVGAGPTGLMAANLLAAHGIDFRIIDKKSRATLYSNAAAVHARSLEALQSLNLSQLFFKAGLRIEYGDIYLGKKLLAEIHFKTIDSEFNYLLSIPQNRSEKILIENLLSLHHKVERDTTLMAIYPFADHVEAVIEKPNSEREKFTANYVLACDGAHSSVRGMADIDFPGNDFDQQFLLADLTFKRNISQHKIRAEFNDKEILFMVPLPTGNVRFIINIPEDHSLYQKETVPLETVRYVCQNRLAGFNTIDKIHWHSFFWIHSKMSAAFQKERIFMLGDAAHIHSPAHGQGMNTGLQDAFNLIWKLALVIKGHSHQKILASYSAERKPVAAEIVKMTDRATHLIANQNAMVIWLKTLAFKMVNRFQSLQHKIVNHIAQLDYEYKDSTIIDYTHRINLRAPKPGCRLPNIALKRQQFMFSLLEPHRHTLLIFLFNTTAEKQAVILSSSICSQYKNLITPVIISTVKKLPQRNNVIQTTRRLLNKKLHINVNAVYLIRPDHYISYCQKNFGADELLMYLGQTFTSEHS